MSKHWSLPFLNGVAGHGGAPQPTALIILNEPFTLGLLLQLWGSSQWRCCADGGANRLYDSFGNTDNGVASESNGDVLLRANFLPNLIKGDLDSIRPEVRQYYEAQGVPVIHDPDQYSTDLMKCISAIQEVQRTSAHSITSDIVLLGGLSGRLDQTIHTLSLLHKLRNEIERIFAVTDESVAWVLDEGEHVIEVDRSIVGPTCGLLPVGIESTILTTHGLKWNLSNQESSFSGLVSTSNAIVGEVIEIKTTRPIWWCIEMRNT